MQRLLEYIQNHPVLAGLAIALAVAVLVYELRNRGQGAASVSPQEAIRLMNQGATVFDVRGAEAFAAGHVAGAKPLGDDQLANAADALKKYKDKLVIVTCERGVSAGAAVRRLQAAGFSKVFNLRGGLTAWRAEGLPLVKP